MMRDLARRKATRARYYQKNKEAFRLRTLRWKRANAYLLKVSQHMKMSLPEARAWIARQ